MRTRDRTHDEGGNAMGQHMTTHQGWTHGTGPSQPGMQPGGQHPASSTTEGTRMSHETHRTHEAKVQPTATAASQAMVEEAMHTNPVNPKKRRQRRNPVCTLGAEQSAQLAALGQLAEAGAKALAGSEGELKAFKRSLCGCVLNAGQKAQWTRVLQAQAEGRALRARASAQLASMRRPQGMSRRLWMDMLPLLRAGAPRQGEQAPPGEAARPPRRAWPRQAAAGRGRSHRPGR